MSMRYENRSFADLASEIDRLRSRNEKLEAKITELSESIKVVGRQNKQLKRNNERYRERLTQVYFPDSVLIKS